MLGRQILLLLCYAGGLYRSMQAFAVAHSDSFNWWFRIDEANLEKQTFYWKSILVVTGFNILLIQYTPCPKKNVPFSLIFFQVPSV